jgi:Domain of unknown function (DUF2019)
MVGRLKDESTDELVARYRDAARGHGEAIRQGDSRTANRDADVVASVYRELRERQRESVLLILLEDPDPSVRGWAGAHALEFAPTEGEPVMEALVTEGEGIEGFNAEITLEEWRAGRLRFP